MFTKTSRLKLGENLLKKDEEMYRNIRSGKKKRPQKTIKRQI